MIDEMQTLEQSGTWDLVHLPPGNKTVCCTWVYTVKVGVDGQIDYLKISLVAKDFT